MNYEKQREKWKETCLALANKFMEKADQVWQEKQENGEPERFEECKKYARNHEYYETISKKAKIYDNWGDVENDEDLKQLSGEKRLAKLDEKYQYHKYKHLKNISSNSQILEDKF